MNQDRVETARADGMSVVESFDRIACHAGEGWDHNSRYHRNLLRHLPAARGAVLDVGCGLGAFSRLLAGRFDRVEGIDFSPGMIARASAHLERHPNLHYTCADLFAHPYPPASFDCVVSIATLHHLPLREALAIMADVLKPGGRLLVLDLYRAVTAGDLLISALGAAGGLVTRAAHPQQSEALRAAWAEHGRLDHYASISDVKAACAALLPGARVRRHIYFRYSLIWTKAQARYCSLSAGGEGWGEVEPIASRRST